MTSLVNKQILLGVTGGIAAYKSAEIVRRLQDAGANVRVVMTQAAQEFITPLTLQALSGHPVHTDLLDPKAEAGMGHIQLARWADLILIAPASASFISRFVQGQASDLLSTVCLATKGLIALAPAMNQAMWANKATAENLQKVRERGIVMFGPSSGIQACGDVGLGRMLDVEMIVNRTADLFESGALAGKRVLITAGPTREAIDPVRYISNHSSGKMGYALANAAIEAGAQVHLISGPVNLPPPERVDVTYVECAEQMLTEVMAKVAACDIFIGAAAVADFRPIEVAEQKLKKANTDRMTIELQKNPDIIATVAALNTQSSKVASASPAQKPIARRFTVGFAAETENVLQHARDKLIKKGLDLVIANDVSNTDIGFNSDANAVTLVEHGNHDFFSVRNKNTLARELITHIANRYHKCVLAS